MTYLSNIEGYIQELCEKHKKLLHDNGGTAFIPLAASDEPGVSYADIKPVYVKVAAVSSSAREGQMAWEVMMEFLSHVDIAQPREEEVTAMMNLTQEIMYDFHARIDMRLDDSCWFVHSLLNPSMQPITLADQHSVGWEYAWRFTTGTPDYNANAWEE